MEPTGAGRLAVAGLTLYHGREHPLGMGATFSAITVLVYQGILTLGASLFQNILTDAIITEMTATGGVMILGIGLLLLEIKWVRVANFLPALAIVLLLVALWEKWGASLRRDENVIFVIDRWLS
jgi:hypothetical protein